MWYTALGDSITAGSGASAPWRAYPAQILRRSAARSVPGGACLHVLAHPWWTTEALDMAVRENDIGPLTQATAVSVWIGGDNLSQAGLRLLEGPRGDVAAVVTAAIRSHQAHLNRLLRFLGSITRARLVVCTQYNPFPNSPLAVQAMAALNDATRDVARRLGVSVAPADTWFAGREAELIHGYRTGRLEDVLRSPDVPVHPNDRGHSVIAAGLWPFLS
ncbi:SGNH/GDSL hydrolase family protein [Alicyclobacillus macrosporangiidus]|uniref:SGNH/GDSL hydrolase family protein n=1 Tax=Alicyclobacillus macrosporangiidus TaxID=392015 RepID=UPI000497117E|nr:SGNH/GDSL hydrolase family protein [Alicyclobacillus macrosporangiidus]